MASRLYVIGEAEARVVLDDLEQLLREVVATGSPARTTAVRYTRCRDALLASPSRSAIPGFVVQCVSVYKFQDFVTLLDPDVGARLAFVDAAFSRGGATLKISQRRQDAFNDFDF